MKRRRLSTFKRILKALEHSSTCAKIKVAAILIKKGRIISTGWNGTPSSMTHCEDIFKGKELGLPGEKTKLSEEHHKFAVHHEIHAEMNAIYNAAENGVSLKDSTIYVIGLPICHDCAKGLIQAGIRRVVTPEQAIPENWQESISSSISIFLLKLLLFRAF